MINIEDYQAYLKQNQPLLKLLKQNNSVVFSSMADVLIVLDYISGLVKEKSRIDEELEVIFDAGFSYFHEQWELITMVYDKYFNRDFISFSFFSNLINYLLYIEDLEDTLRDKELLTEERKQVLREIYDDIEQKLIHKIAFKQDLLDDYDFRLQSIIPDGTTTTMEIFSLIVEELQL